MDVPSPLDGVVKEIKVKVGDKVSEGSLILIADAEVAPAGVAPREKVREGGHATGAAKERRLRTMVRLPASTLRSRCACLTSAISRTYLSSMWR